MIVVLFSAGHGVSPRGFWSSWVEEPLMVVAVFALVAAYVTGRSRLQGRSARIVFPAWRTWCYAGGVLAFVLALLSPIAAYSEELFAMHMVQHLLLLLVAPPLLLLGAPLIPLLWALPGGARRRVSRWLRPGQPLAVAGHWLTTPVVAMLAYVVTVAVWHIPAFYDRAQGRTFMHDLEHVMFYGTALLYWWPIVFPGGGRRRLGFGMAIPYLLPPFFEGMIIGIWLAFSNRPLYATYLGLDDHPIWGLSALDDQQLAGLIMWVPGGLFFLIPLLGLLARLLNQEERHPQHPGKATGAR